MNGDGTRPPRRPRPGELIAGFRNKIAVFIDDAAYARPILQPLMGSATPTHCALVACPPRLSRRIGKCADRLLREVVPLVRVVAGGKVERLKADQPLADLSVQLRSRLGGDTEPVRGVGLGRLKRAGAGVAPAPTIDP